MRRRAVAVTALATAAAFAAGGATAVPKPPPAPGAVFPVITHTHGSGFCSITGGYVVRDPGLPRLAGRYLYSDFCDSRIRAVRLRPGSSPPGTPLGLPKIAQVASFGEDARGRVYVVSLAGAVYRLAAAR
jgi:hypothetical protein